MFMKKSRMFKNKYHGSKAAANFLKKSSSPLDHPSVDELSKEEEYPEEESETEKTSETQEKE